MTPHRATINAHNAQADAARDKHTPGPWTWDGQRGVPRHCCVAQVWRPDGMSLAMIEPTDDASEADANACLIAAAPEMLDALRMAERFMSGFEGDDLQDGIDEKIAATRAVIAKAEGR